jgi:hypothetical protein
VLRNNLAAAIATIVRLAVGAPSAAYADAFKPATGGTKTAIAKIAKTRGFVGLYAVLVAKGRVGNVRYGVACGNGPGRLVSSPAKRTNGGRWRAHNRQASGAIQTYDMACYVRSSSTRARGARSARMSKSCGLISNGGALYFDTRASRARCSSARRVLTAFFNRGGAEHSPGYTRTVDGWKCRFLRYYDPGAAAYRCRLRENPRHLAVAYWSGDND